MAQFFLPKCPSGTMNFSVIRDDGMRLSFAADDSCGVALKGYVRTYLQAFDHATGNNETSQQTDISPEDYLAALADFLGYDLVKR